MSDAMGYMGVTFRGKEEEPELKSLFFGGNRTPVETSFSDEVLEKILDEAQQYLLSKLSTEEAQSVLGKRSDHSTRAKLQAIINRFLSEYHNEYEGDTKSKLLEELYHDIACWGPLTKLLDDPDVTEVIARRFDNVIYESDGDLKHADVKFRSETHLNLFISLILSPIGVRADAGNTFADARLPDGSRIAVTLPPTKPDGAMISIRKFKPEIGLEELVAYGAITSQIKDALIQCVKARLTILISGGTGSGKTTMLNALAEHYEPNLNIITIENPIETQFSHPLGVTRWEPRKANISGQGEVTMLDLVSHALRNRPDVIVVGEVRRAEAYAWVDAANTGHDGSMCSVHGNTPQHGYRRLNGMVKSAEILLPDMVPEFIGDAVDLVIQLNRMDDSSRKCTSICSMHYDTDSNEVKILPLVIFEKTGLDANGKIVGHYVETGNLFPGERKIRAKGNTFVGWTEKGADVE